MTVWPGVWIRQKAKITARDVSFPLLMLGPYSRLQTWQTYQDRCRKHALRAILGYQTILNALKDPAVFKDLQVFGLCKEQLVRILLRTHHASSRILHGHLL